MSLYLPSICFECKHWNEDKIECPAFPLDKFEEGIPQEIIDGRNDHSKKIKDQVGDYIFEKNEL